MSATLSKLNKSTTSDRFRSHSLLVRDTKVRVLGHVNGPRRRIAREVGEGTASVVRSQSSTKTFNALDVFRKRSIAVL